MESKTVLFDESMIEQLKNGNRKKSLIIADGNGINEYDLSEYTDAVFQFGRGQSNSFVIKSSIVSSNHGEINISGGEFYIKDNGSSNGTYIADGPRFVRMQPYQYYGGTGRDVIVRLGSPDTDIDSDTVLMLYDSNSSEGKWKTYALHEGDNSIGRSDSCDITLSNVSVSRLHAGIRVTGQDVYVFDNKSANGVYLNGERILSPVRLKRKDIITILNTTFIFDGNCLFYKVGTEGIELVTKGLTKVVGKKNAKKRILDNVDLTIKPNEFVAIIGGSGAGKTTLMTAMSGFDTKVSGDVICNGLNLRENFHTLKNVIGFVPQQDIIYENITLKKMLYYTAKMKMPEDTKTEEIYKRIEDVLKMVELESHKDTYIRKLSGGQKKRASIAVELLANPGLFFLDEPTSGLDPGTEQHLMQTLSRLSKEQEKTIIMVTHNTNNIHLCDKVIIMGYGGKLCYCGAPENIKDFFNTDDIVEVYDMITENTAEWESRFRQYNNIPVSAENTASGKPIKPKHVSSLNQLGVLIRRYVTLIKNDVERLLMIFLQPVLIGLLMALVAEEGVYTNTFETQSILFALMSAGIWMGIFNTIQEVYKERVILKREYMSNLKLWVYMLSKYFVQLVIAMIQAVILIAVFVLIKGAPKCSGVIINNASVEMTLTIFITIFVSAALGLFVSAISKNGDRAMGVAPFILIIQLLFSGILFALSGATDKISYFTISRWSMEVLGSTNDLNGLRPLGADAEEEYEQEAEEMKEEMQATIDEMAETIESLQEQVEQLSEMTGQPVTFDETDSDYGTDEGEETGTSEEDETEEEEEGEARYERTKEHVLRNWGLLLGASVLLGAASIAVLTRLKNEQR